MMCRFEVTALLLALLAGCGHKTATQDPEPAADEADASTPESGAGDGGSLADAGLPELDGGAHAVTWYAQAMPIVRERCQGCHASGGIAPFPLTTYADAQTHAQAIAVSVSTRQMPPWMPGEGCRDLVGSRRLAQAEIDTLVAWSEGGAREGNPADAPPPVDRNDNLPRVDAMLSPAQAYTPAPTGPGTDDYRCLVLDPQLAVDRDVVGLDIQPGVRSIVHHVVLFEAPKAAALAAQGANNGWTCFGGTGLRTSAIVGAWVPGTLPTLYPATTGVTVHAGNVLIMQVHYNTSSARPAPDRTQVSLMYSPDRVPFPAVIDGPIDVNFTLPPMSRDFSSSSSQLNPASRVWGALPHMHTRGKKIRIDSTPGCLVDLPAWQFHWQQFYFFSRPVSLAAGDRTTVTCTWDNPGPTTIRFGENTGDEMCVGFLYKTL